MSLRDVSMLLVAALGVCAFVVLTGSATNSRLEVTRTVDANYRSSYDILVRPKGSQTQIEADRKSVRPNYLSGIYGGISLAQAKKIRNTPGVDIAAPIAMVGQVVQNIWAPIDVSSAVKPGGTALLRFSSSGSNAGGLNKFAGPAGYTYVASGVSSDFGAGEEIPVTQRIDGQKTTVCADESVRRAGPFSADARWFPQCWDRDTGLSGTVWPDGRGRFEVRIPLRVPVTVAAIDPAAEAALTGLDEAMYQGDYLSPGDGVEPDIVIGPTIPVIYSNRSYVREAMQVQIDRLGPATVTQLQQGLRQTKAKRLIQQAPTTGSRTEKVSVSRALEAWAPSGELFPRAFYEAGPVEFSGTAASARLTAEPQPVAEDVWDSFVLTGEPYAPTPWSAQDPGFRQLGVAGGIDPMKMPTLSVRGTFDPTELMQGTTLGKVPLETYQSPAVAAGDDRTRELLDDKDLFPSSNPAGYLQNPPLMLTTMKALPGITDPGIFSWADRDAKSDRPISVVRVRVAGVTGADEVSRERVRVVAEAIQAATGLDVDVTIGSSPAPTTVQVATGSGPIAVQEMWVQKGVADRVVKAIDRKSLGLFILVLLTTGLSVGISANASVRARQRELAVLACLGWRPSTLYRSVISRLLVVGALAGILGAAASWPVGELLDTPVSAARAALAIPAGIVLMLIVSVWPAMTAARATPAATIRSVARAPRRPRRLNGPVSLGIAYLARRPSRAFTAALTVAVGVASLVILVGISIGFKGTVVGNLLGNAVALQVRSADLTAGAILGLIGFIAVLDVLILDVKEQAPGYASLQASGWRDAAILRLVMTQSVAISTAGALTGSLAGLIILHVLVGLTSTIVGVTAAITAAWILTGALISLLPGWTAIHLNTARILAEEAP